MYICRHTIMVLFLCYYYTLRSCVDTRHRHTDGLLADYCDGSDFRCHSLYSWEKNSLQVMIYYDDVEVCNPLGTKVKLHKLGMFVSSVLIKNISYTCRPLLLYHW